MEVCGLHVQMLETIDRIERKLDAAIEGREQIALQVALVQKTIDNGLRADIKVVVEAIKSFDRRIVVLENFSWFREWVTELRTNMFKNVIKMATVCILGLVLVHATDKVINDIVKGLLK